MSNFAARAAVVPTQNIQTVTTAKQDDPKVQAAIASGLAEVRVDNVRVDGLALMKIIKHAREAHQVIPAPAGTSNATISFSPAVGQLLGIDSNGTLEVSNVFALPPGSLGGGEGDSETRGARGANKYTSQLLPRLNDLKADASLVGFYASTNNGQQLAMSGFVDALLGAQLNGGGIGGGAKAVPVGRSAAAKGIMVTSSAPGSNKSGKGIALVFDVASANQGHVGLKAFRLSAAFVEAHRAGKFDTQSLIDHKLVPSNILEELPVSVHSSPLLTAFLSTLVTPSAASSSSAASVFLSARPTPLSIAGSFAPLSLSTSAASSPAPLSGPITALISALDTHQAHLSTLSFQSRQLARDRARIESANPNIARRKAENEQRIKDGQAPLPLNSDEIALAALIEPSRLETMCALAGVEGAVRVLSESTGVEVVKSYGSRAGTAQV